MSKENSIRILFDEQIFSNQKFGGISRYYTELVKALGTKDNVTAKLISPLCTNYHANRTPRLHRIGLPFPVIAGTESLLWHFNKKASKHYIKQFSPDILHQTYYPIGNYETFSGPRVVTTVHDMIHELFPESFRDAENVAERKLQAVKNADLTICVSENTRKDLIEITGIEHAKTVVIHHGIDHMESHPLPAFGPLRKPYFLYVGLRHTYKNFQRVLKAYVKCPGLLDQYDLVCFGGGMLSQSETELISRLNIPKDNIFLTSGNDTTLRSLYQHADAFLYPSLYEGFGLPPLEAMMQGCPVISSNVSSLPEVLGPATEYFDPHNTDDLVEAIARVVNNPQRSAELISLGYIQARKFTWDHCAEQTLTAYKGLI